MTVDRDATTVNIKGLVPGVPYDVEARSVGPTGLRSIWVNIVHTGVTNPTVLEIFSSGGVLTIDCFVIEQFKLRLIEDITSVLFLNVPAEKTVILDIDQTGDFTIDWPGSVSYYNGIPYEVSLGGTPSIPKHDVVGLHTDTSGILWSMRYENEVNPTSGGGGGSGDPGGGTGADPFVAIAPSPAYAYSSSDPAIIVTATGYNGTPPYTCLWTREAGGTGDWAGSSGNTGGGNFTCSDTTSFTPVFSRTGSINGTVVQNWKCAVLDADSRSFSAIVEIALEDDGAPDPGGGYHCPWEMAFLPDGRRARDVTEGSLILSVDPVGMGHFNAKVSKVVKGYAQCVRLVCANGFYLTCSLTAPIPTRNSELIDAPDMLGKETITWNGYENVWSEVVAIQGMGVLPVVHITAEDACFFVGDCLGFYLAHHNIKWDP
jgi:hypothetical protein